MGLFDFLGDPAAAGAFSQFGVGQQQGQQDALRHLASQQLMDYRNAQLQATQQNRQQRLTQQQHDVQARLVAPLIKQRYSAEYKTYYDRNPEEAAALDRIIGAHAQGFAPDTNDLLTVKMLPPTGGDQGPGAGAAPPNAPTAPAAPVDTPGLPQGSVPFDYGAGAPDTANISDTGLQGPRSYDTPFGPAPSTQLLPKPQVPSVFSGEPEGGLPQSAPETPTAPAGGPGGNAAAPSPAAPLSLADELRQRFREGPRKGQTDKAFKDEIAAAAKIAGIDLREVLTGAQVPMLNSLTKRNDAQTGLDKTKTAEEELSFGPKMENLTARTAGVKATTAQTIALTPERVSQIRSTIEHQRREEQVAATNAVRAEQEYQEAKRHNLATEQMTRQRDASLGTLRTAQTSRIQTLLDNGDAVKMSPQDRAALQEQSRIYFTGARDLAGNFEYQFPDEMRAAAGKAVNGIMQKYGQSPIQDPMLGGGTQQVAAPTGTMGPTHGSTGGAGTAQPAVTPQEKAGMTRLIQGGSVHAALQHATPQQADRLRFLYQQMTGKGL